MKKKQKDFDPIDMTWEVIYTMFGGRRK